MARIRSVKPEFWTAEQVMELSRDARLLFIGMWNFCDDRGVHPASLKTLKAQVLPADELDLSAVGMWVDELLAARLLVGFEAEGRAWWWVTGWHHQVINRPSRSRYPAPPAALTGEGVSVSAHGWSGGEWTGVDGKGEEGSGLAVQEGGLDRDALSGVDGPGKSRAEGGLAARQGELVMKLNTLGIDAPPHLSVWNELLARFEDGEIVAAAEVARTRKPGERIHLNYLVPMLTGGRSVIKGGERRAASRKERESADREYGAGGGL